ncbi:MAG TPA: DUF6150 family protein [Williamwhitmania sp.]|jgi:hypothetical protein|nr:DUF6150 family protein [Williamwhitmania sp.]
MARFLFPLGLLLFLVTTSGKAQLFFEADKVEDAQVKVFNVDNPDDADFYIYFVNTKEEVTKIGFWMEVETAKEAQVKIIFVDDEKQADFKVCAVDDSSKAGWKNLYDPRKSLLNLNPPDSTAVK